MKKKIVVAGSRDIHEAAAKLAIQDRLGHRTDIGEIVAGKARGVDTYAEEWALANGHAFRGFPAEWKKYGLGAGMIRNYQQGEYGDELLALWDGKSRGTKHMIDVMERQGKKVDVVIIA